MDDKLFKEKLSEIAKWYTPIVSEGRGASGALRKPLPESDTNPTLGPVIESLNPQLRPCEWCSTITDQRQNHTLKFTSVDGRRPKRRWEHSCQTCRRHWDEKTGKLKENKNKKPPEPKKQTYWWNEGIDTQTTNLANK